MIAVSKSLRVTTSSSSFLTFWVWSAECLKADLIFRSWLSWASLSAASDLARALRREVRKGEAFLASRSHSERSRLASFTFSWSSAFSVANE
ncbi:hypothetical protein PF005_g25345, partial [Phytophthora fragariae]